MPRSAIPRHPSIPLRPTGRDSADDDARDTESLAGAVSDAAVEAACCECTWDSTKRHTKTILKYLAVVGLAYLGEFLVFKLRGCHYECSAH